MKNTPFNELLKSPHLLASMPIEELENITKNYPWFSLAHSYLAKAYQENNSHKTSGQIALASTLHSNRTWLYGFLKEPILQKEKQTELAPALPTETNTALAVEDVPSKATTCTSLAELAASMMDEEIEGREDKRGEERGREDKRREEEGREEKEKEKQNENENEREEGSEDKRGEEKVREDLDILEKSILATAVSSSIFLEVSETNSSEEIPQDAEQDSAKDASQGPEQDSAKDVIQDSAKDASQGPEQDSAKDASQGPAEGGENEALFTWLRSVSDYEEETTERVREVKRGEERVREDKRREEEGRNSVESVQPTIDLIEKFIANEPRITPGKVEQYTGVSFAKDSLEENFDWVTETMAKLYASQGKIDRARKAYKRLIEMHPEKKIHFENQLKALNQRK